MLKEIAEIKNLPFGSIKLTDGYCVNALAREIDYLKAFENDRVLCGFRKNAGLDTRGAEPYGGWESLLIGGHAMGHYFVALAQASANPGVSEEDRKALAKKLGEIMDGLKECQLPNGFLWGSSILDPDNIEVQFDNVEKGLSHLFKEAWVPWYTMHKILEGLVAAYTVGGNETALEIAKKLGGWVYNRVTGWDPETRKVTLRTEYGGMNDIMYELYRVTGDERYAAAAHAFDEEPLMNRIFTKESNMLTGLHANTNIPKVIGYLRRYQLCHGKTVGGEKVDASQYLEAAKKFWDNVLTHHTYHTGGNSEWEHFREDDSLDAKRTNCNCETCNVYNMLKLTRELFKITGERKYADYLENAFLNHILASQNPETGMTTYFQSMATGYFKVFSSRWDDFWCCTGSGMENMTKLGDSVCFGDKNGLWVVSYLSSEISLPGARLRIKTSIPSEDTASVEILEGENLPLSLRIPDWAKGPVEITKNGRSCDFETVGGFAKLTAGAGDKVEIRIPLGLSVKTLCDNPNAFALRFGPLLLAAKLGSENMTQTRTGVNVAIPEKSVSDGRISLECSVAELAKKPEKYVERTGGCEFRLGEMTFIPYYLIEERYGIYWTAE